MVGQTVLDVRYLKSKITFWIMNVFCWTLHNHPTLPPWVLYLEFTINQRRGMASFSFYLTYKFFFRWIHHALITKHWWHFAPHTHHSKIKWLPIRAIGWTEWPKRFWPLLGLSPTVWPSMSWTGRICETLSTNVWWPWPSLTASFWVLVFWRAFDVGKWFHSFQSKFLFQKSFREKKLSIHSI